MLLLLLVHLLIFHLLTAKDASPPKDTKYVIRPIDSCPSVGYFFKKDTPANSLFPGTCYLCFCREDNTAICWKRENRRCDAQSFHYQYPGLAKRESRIRRSPGFADLFFRDATRDVFNKNSATQCKPFESSFSNDCPPVDWCTGCTVCDCDANGRWDCHILSFCADDKSKKKSKRKGSRTAVAKKPVKKPKPNTHKKVPPKPNPKNNKTSYKGKPKTIPPIKHGGNKYIPPQKRIVKKSAQYNQPSQPQRRRPPIRYNRIIPSKAEQTKEKIIKKNIATHKPVDIGSSKVNLEMEIAQKVMKKVMANLRKSITSEMKNVSMMATKVAQKNYNKNFRKPPPRKSKPNQKPKKVNKRQVKKPKRKAPYRKPPNKPRKPFKPANKPSKPAKKPMKKPAKKPNRKPIHKPFRKPAPKPARKPPQQYIRNKRDVNITEVIDNSTTYDQEKPAESTNTTVLHGITSVTSNMLLPNDNYSHPQEQRTTPPENEYYKYNVGVEQPQVIADATEGPKGSTQVKKTETVLNLIGSDVDNIAPFEKSINDSMGKSSNITNITELNPNTNDLNFSKWSHLKILKEKQVKSGSDKHKSLVKLIAYSNKTILQDSKKKVHGKEVERLLNSRKYNIVKLLNLPRCSILKMNETNSSSNTQNTNKKTGNLQSLLTNMLRGFRKNSTSYPPKKNKKFYVLRYLKRILNKIFKRKKTPNKLNKHQLIKTLCENFGPCKVSRRDKIILDAKLTELDVETKRIMKIVRIIKGLLKLVDFPKSRVTNSSDQENNFRNDMHKLNAILKKNYAGIDQTPLTATQLIQIEYIKKNTQDFIKTVSKFASLLNEIIVILTKHNDPNSSRNRGAKCNNPNKDVTKDPFQSLKQLLERYNLVQNTFMNRIYEQINNFENKMYEKPKVSEVNSEELNNSVAIENFSRNIIQNLRKLKSLAQTVSYRGRTKRQAMRDDDAIEYLLMLMEYLLKQNHPLDVAPVNDGIDLLIEAIKSAPDIKPIKKKVLEITPATYPDSTTTPSVKFITYVTSTEAILVEDESDKTSSEDSSRIIKIEDPDDNLKKVEENKELVEIIAEDDKDSGDKFQFDRRAGMERPEDITEMSFYNRIDDNIALDSDIIFETTTRMGLEMEFNDTLENQEDINMDKQIPIESNNLDKPLDGGEVEPKKFEVFVGDMEEEPISTAPVTTLEEPTTINTEFFTQARKSRTKMRHLNLESFDSVDKQSKLEWIEENFGRKSEINILDAEDNNSTIPISAPVTTESVQPKVSEKADISSLTREVVDELDKKKRAKINAEEVMFRKQMDLLNSLDYGTEKGEVYESDSKDGNTDDRYPSDPYPSYFV